MEEELSIPGVCQTCGTTAPLEWFLCHGKYKQCDVVIARLPSDVAPATVRYLSLFRPASGRSMSPDKALRLLLEIEKLVSSGYVQVDRLPARPCPPTIWADAMDRMRENPKLRVPMPNHNYLRDVAYDMADAADVAREKKIVEAEQSGTVRSSNHVEKNEQGDFTGCSREFMNRLPAKVREKYGLQGDGNE